MSVLSFCLVALAAALPHVVAAQAPVDVSTNLLGLVNAAPNLTVEFAPAPRLGIETSAYYLVPVRRFGASDYRGRGYRAEVAANFYPAGEYGGFALGGVIRYSALDFRREADVDLWGQDDDAFAKRRLVLGMTVGGKWVFDPGLVLKLAGGLGGALIDDYDRDDGTAEFSREVGYRRLSLTLRLGVGYRFGYRAAR